MSEKNFQWVFSEKNDPERVLMDDFLDSKFNNDHIASFTREIIQNSLDARLDKNKPVYVDFCINDVKRDSIPGINEITDALKCCIENVNHPETKNKFERALHLLSSTNVKCLKVSDFNTKGMNKEGWDALIFKLGKSYKNDEFAAGRHGVGKKASFLMSLCNTVYYSSKFHNEKSNIDEYRFTGKTILVDFEKEGKWYNRKGWFGKKDGTDVLSLNEKNYDLIDDYFVRKNDTGSDVIVLCPAEPSEETDLETLVINSLLENFFVGLAENKLVVKVNDTLVDSNTLEEILNNYYISKFSKQVIPNSNIAYGLLKDFKNAYFEMKSNPYVIPVDGFDDDSHLDLYISLSSEKSKKYYSFYRDHGMKIKDERLSEADKNFAAVVVARGNELNTFLLKLENEAHDDFVVDENAPIDERRRNRSILSRIRQAVIDKILDLTKMIVSDEIELDELNDLIDNPGEINRKMDKQKSQKRKPKAEIKATIQGKTTKVTEEEWRERIKPLDPVPFTPPNPVPPPGPDPRPLPYEIETKEDGNEEKLALKDVQFEKILITLRDCYYMKFSFKNNLKNVSIKLIAKNVDDNLNDVNYMIDYIECNDRKISNAGYEYIILGDLEAGDEMSLKIHLKNNARYKLFGRIIGKEYETKE